MKDFSTARARSAHRRRLDNGRPRGTSRDDRHPAKGVAAVEYRLFLLAVGLVGLHIVDDNFLQPEPGTSAGITGQRTRPDRRPCGLRGRLSAPRAGARAYVSMTLGALAIAIGTPGMYHLVDGGASSDDYTGLLAIVAGVALLIAGPVTLWKARRRAEPATAVPPPVVASVGAVAIGLATFWFIVFPVGFPYSTPTSARPRLLRSHRPFGERRSPPATLSTWPRRMSRPRTAPR